MELACRVILLLLLPFNFAIAQNASREGSHELHVGVILDLGSMIGKIARTSISLAMEDFYDVHPNSSTKLVLHIRDSMRDDVQAASQGSQNFANFRGLFILTGVASTSSLLIALIIYFYKKKHKSTNIVSDNENRPEESGVNEENSEAQEGNQGDEQNTQQAGQEENGLEEQTSLEVVSETTDRQALFCPTMGQLPFSGVK